MPCNLRLDEPNPRVRRVSTTKAVFYRLFRITVTFSVYRQPPALSLV